MDMKKWFKEEAKFGMMIHFGLYSLLAGEYKGRRTDKLGEWIQKTFKIPCSEYSELAKAFNPIYFDAEEWAKTAKEAGMNYMVVTSKHHEGFCLFDSEYDDFNCVKGSPFGRDIIAECAAACKKYGLKLGIYYSQELDWHEPNGGGYVRTSQLNTSKPHWTNDWDFPDDDAKDFDQYFCAKALPQVRELLTKYGDLCLMWFDLPSVITKEQSTELRQLVKSIQPECLINSRIGNGLEDYGSCGDNQIVNNYHENLAESPITLNDTWGFKYFDDNWKSADRVIEIKEKLNKNGVNCLLNVGPDHLGRLPSPAVEILKEVGKKLNN